MMSGTSCAGRFAGTLWNAIFPVPASNDPSRSLISCHGARYSQRSPICSVTVLEICQLSSMNGASVGDRYVDRELPNAPVQVEQYPRRKSATELPVNWPLNVKLPRGGTSVRCSNLRYCACNPKRRLWLPFTQLV